MSGILGALHRGIVDIHTFVQYCEKVRFFSTKNMPLDFAFAAASWLRLGHKMIVWAYRRRIQTYKLLP